MQRACGKRARREVRGWKPRLPVSLFTRRRALKARAYEKRGWKPRLPGWGLTRQRACGQRARCEVRGWKPRLPMKSAVGNRAYRVGACLVDAR